MILNDCREEWERGLEEVGMFPSSTGGTCVILKYVRIQSLVQKSEQKVERFSLHRYFAVGDEWQCSVDVNGGTCEQCVKKLSELFHA